jgi:hypothetical protein
LVPRDLDLFGLAIVVGGSFEVRHISGRVLPSGRNAAALAAMPVTAATASIIDAIGTVQAIDSVSVQQLFLIDPRPCQAALDRAKDTIRGACTGADGHAYVVGDDNNVALVEVQQAAPRGDISVIANGVSVGQAVDGIVVAVEQTQASRKAFN